MANITPEHASILNSKSAYARKSLMLAGREIRHVSLYIFSGLVWISNNRIVGRESIAIILALASNSLNFYAKLLQHFLRFPYLDSAQSKSLTSAFPRAVKK